MRLLNNNYPNTTKNIYAMRMPLDPVEAPISDHPFFFSPKEVSSARDDESKNEIEGKKFAPKSVFFRSPSSLAFKQS